MSIPTKEIQLPPSFEDPEQYLETLVSFLKRYQWLIDIHVVDFITHKQWNQLDLEWRRTFLAEDGDIDDDQAWFTSVIDLLAENSQPCKDTWPKSLKKYIETIKNLTLPRRNLYTCEDVIDKRMASGMTDKKIHEVELMSNVIKTIADKRGIASVMDLGAGQGYLSRALAFQHDFQVLAVDMSEVQTRGAQKFDKKASKLINKRDNSVQLSKLHHVTEKVTPENVSHILRKWGSHGAEESEEKWLVCGLHACGDLSAMSMRLFAESKIACLVNVGCCYHYLSEEGDSAGFPMSNILRNINYRMGTTAQVLACQSPARWAEQKAESLNSFEHHFFKAILQFIMVEKGLTRTSSPLVIGRINKKKDFPTYVQTALKRLNLPVDSISKEEAEQYYRSLKEKKIDKKLIVTWTLRALLAPVLESVILVDRWLYLKDAVKSSANPHKGVWMWPLFDPSTSPRNVVFVASK
ncbi:hypothetical protein EC973_003688 [Apophysomyces ossiformis]|uniref:Methyltransferase domain-containing protein n=1 Tax=Apophysomyces ossiformis TaxID=679940 RepID=A0A8H7BGW9_9FUNG|nr:hypothetical protein EC973_003688 [Apophysomyces ossiformis]